MARRYLAFDIETAKDVPGEDFNWRPHRPLGISSATLASDSSEVRLWHGKTRDGAPAQRMTAEDANGLVQYLSEMNREGFTIVTWNGLGFDLDILAEESGTLPTCQELRIDHVDLMFHILCSQGYPVASIKPQGMGLPGKPSGMTGIQAPRSWAEGRFQEVLEYVAKTCEPPCSSRRRVSSGVNLCGSRARAPGARCRCPTVGARCRGSATSCAGHLVDVSSLEPPGIRWLVVNSVNAFERQPNPNRLLRGPFSGNTRFKTPGCRWPG